MKLVISVAMRNGFTLIELVIVIVIIAIIGTILMLRLSDFQTSKNLDNDVEKIVFTLRTAREKAVSQDRGLQWGVHFENPSSGSGFYELFAGSSYPGQTVYRNNLSVGVQFSSPASSSSIDIFFSKITGSASASTSIIISPIDDVSVSKTISIPAASGEIRY